MTTHPYRQDGDGSIVSDEAEAAAIAQLAQRKQRLDGICFALGVAAGFAAVGLSMLRMNALIAIELRCFGAASVTGSWLLLLAIPVGISRLLFRAVLRRRRPVWLADASERTGVPIDRLRWVL